MDGLMERGASLDRSVAAAERLFENLVAHHWVDCPRLFPFLWKAVKEIEKVRDEEKNLPCPETSCFLERNAEGTDTGYEKEWCTEVATNVANLFFFLLFLLFLLLLPIRYGWPVVVLRPLLSLSSVMTFPFFVVYCYPSLSLLYVLAPLVLSSSLHFAQFEGIVTVLEMAYEQPKMI